MPEIPVVLEPEPEVGRHPQNTLEAQGGIGRHRTFSVDDLVEPRKRDSQASREGGLAYAQGTKELLQKHLPRMGRWAARWQAARRARSDPCRSLMWPAASSDSP